jgi:hypothetical protein
MDDEENVSRITYADGTPNQQRNSLRRAIAEVLRRMSAKSNVDVEVKDMAAFIVFSLREIAASVDKSATAWEKRDYYLKADAFRRDWAWVESAANRLHAALREERWADLPLELAQLTPKFADVRVTQLTRPTTLWQGCYNRLVQSR